MSCADWLSACAGVMPASMGRPQFPTPVGVYTVMSKERTVLMDSSSVGVPITDPAGYRTPVNYASRISRAFIDCMLDRGATASRREWDRPRPIAVGRTGDSGIRLA